MVEEVGGFGVELREEDGVVRVEADYICAVVDTDKDVDFLEFSGKADDFYGIYTADIYYFFGDF